MIEVPELLKPIDKQAPQPDSPPSNVSMLADAARSFGQQQGQDFLHSMETVAKINPDSYAKATAVSRYSGVPAKVLHDNTDRMNQLLRGNEYAGIYDRYRKTANALRDGNLAAISQDDLDQLTRIEGAASDSRFNERSLGEKLFGAIRQQWVAMRQATNVADTANLVQLSTQFDEIDAEIARAAEAGEQPFAGGNVPGGFGGQYLLASPEERQQMRANLQAQQQDQLQSAITDEAELAAMPVDPGARRAAELEALGRSSLSATAEALGEFPGFGVRTAVGAGATSLPMLAAGAVGGPVAAGAVGFGTEYDAKLLDVLREAGVDASDPKAILRALQDENLMQDAERRAALKAGGTTAVDMISMGLASKLLAPSRIAGRSLTQGQRELVNLAIQVPVQGVSEGLGEAAGQFAAEGEVDAGEVLLETVAGAGMSSLDVIAFSNRRLIENLGDGLRRARAARVGSESLDEMVDASLASKTRGRDADTFGAIAQAQLADSPMETLWIPAEALQRLNQSSQVNLPELLQQVPGLGEQFAEAAARGGSVSIKTSDYLKLFADYHQELGSSVRISVDGMSPAEVDAWTAEQEAQMDDLAASLSMEPDQQRVAFDETVGQLVAAGFRRADAEQYAATHLSVLNNLAERTGQALEQIRGQFPLNIRTQAPEPLKRVKVDDARLAIQRLRTGDIPRPADMFGQSLREYLMAGGGVSDEGGELAALDAGVGRVGRNRLTRAGGKSLDQAAMDAWERGYFPGVPREEVGPQLIIDAIQREQAGQPVYSTEQENATLREQADTLNQLQDYLDRLGVDLEQMTDDEVLALLQGGAEQIEGRRQDQFAGPTAWTADVAALADAQQRLADGDTPEQVRRETGWFQGVDGRWRFEIDDSQTQFQPLDQWVDRATEPERVTLRDVLDHPALFAAYPEIGRVWVVVDPARQGGGYFAAAPGRGLTGSTIVIGDPESYAEGVTPAIDVLMHEIQHAIQTREGFATGGSPEVLRAEKDQAMADRDYWSAVATIRRDAERMGGDFEQAARDYIDIFEQAVTDQQMEDARKAESLQVLEQRVQAAEQVMRQIGNPTATYQRLAGEIEARNTEGRRTMTAEERRAASPEQTADTPGEDAIVWWNGTEMVSLAVDAQADAGMQRLNQAPISADLQRALAMSEDEYIAAINPTGKTTAEDDVVLVSVGDLERPADSRLISTASDSTGAQVDIYESADGILYAEQDGQVVGELESRDGETLNIVAQEVQGRGIGTLLAMELIRREPFAQAGSLSPAGERTRRAAFRRLKAEQQVRLNQSAARKFTAPEDAATGKPMTVYFARNTVSAKNSAPAGMDFGQKIEPAGEYMVVQDSDMSGQGGDGWVYGTVTFKNPLVLEHKSTNSTGWKKDLSEMFGGKTGKALSNAVKKAGYDGVVTRDKYGYSETVNLSGVKTDKQRLNQGETRQQLEARLIEQNPGLKLDLLGRGKRLLLSRIELPKEGRQQGAGTRIMQEITAWADANGATVSLSPSSDFGGNKKRLVEFYKRFGFVENKGRNRDFEISEAMYRMPRLEQAGDDQARGFITFTPRGQGDRRFQITLGEKRDLSTFLHELGHYYLEVIDEIAAGENAPQQIAADVATIRQWLGAEQGAPLTTEQHEQFARGFEAYLAEGKAPNPELAGAFARFKRWLIAIYKDLTRLNVELNDDVRRVFDRLVATDEQIVAAEQVSNAIPLFRDAQAAGMTEEEFAAYQDSIELAHADARDAVEEEVVREEERRRSKWWREESARVRNEVTEEVDTLPEYAAMRALRKGIMPDGSQLNLKLNSAELTERYGAGVTRRLAFTHSKTGQPLDVVAPMLGYESGDELVKALLGAPSRAEAIRRETDQRMLERHGPRSTGETAERALDAVHNERRADVLAKELRRLGQVGNRRNITSQQILKEAARRVMSQRKVRDIQPAEYQRAEAKAGREAFEAFTRGNLEAAYEAKQRQLLNFYMYREARKAREQIDGIVNRLAKYNKRSKREQLGKAGHDYLDQIDAVMEQYEFRNVSLRELDKRVSFQAWYADQLAQGNEPFVPEFILNTTKRVNYKELSLAQLQELDEFVANVNHLAKIKNQLIANKRLRDFDEARSELIRVGYENLAKRRPPPIDKNTRSMLERIGDQAGELSSALIKMEQVIDWLDGGQVDGPWSTTFWQPFVDAQGQKEQLNREFAIKMADLVDAYTKERGAKVMQQKTHIDSLGESLTHNAILSAALNTGNEGNRTKLLNGGHNGKAWTEQQLNEITGNLTARDWEFVQSMWDLVDELWPAISQLEKDLHGIPPEKVEAVPVQTQFGVFRGGYWPLVYDTSSSAYAGVQNQLGNEGGLFEQGYARATTPKGHTKARVDSFAAPILLDVEIVAQHLGQVIHDLTHRKAIRDGAKIIGDKQIKQMLIDTLGPAVANQFNPWLQGVANDMVLDSQKGIDAWTRTAERLRANLSVGFLGFSATTGLQQILGYSQTFEFFSKIGAKRYVFRGMQQFITKPFETVEFVNQLSSEMRYRVDNLDRDMRGVLKQISGKSGFLDVVQRLAFKHIGLIQAMVDYPTWLAGYYHGLDSGLTAEDAVRAGDRAVRLSQMAAGPKDLAAVQRKDGLMRALTIVYSYFNLLYNRTVDLKNSASAARSVGEYLNAFERTMFLIAIPAIAGPLVTGQGPGDDEDWRAWASLKILTYPLLGIPGVRDLASSLESGWAYRGATPIGEVFNTLSKFRGVATNVVEGNENDTARVAGLTIDAVGYTFGLPTAQPKRTAKYLIGVAEGDIEPEGVTDWVRGVLFGPPKE